MTRTRRTKDEDDHVNREPPRTFSKHPHDADSGERLPQKSSEHCRFAVYIGPEHGKQGQTILPLKFKNGENQQMNNESIASNRE